jgi:hypothetical protein
VGYPEYQMLLTLSARPPTNLVHRGGWSSAIPLEQIEQRARLLQPPFGVAVDYDFDYDFFVAHGAPPCLRLITNRLISRKRRIYAERPAKCPDKGGGAGPM